MDVDTSRNDNNDEVDHESAVADAHNEDSKDTTVDLTDALRELDMDNYDDEEDGIYNSTGIDIPRL